LSREIALVYSKNAEPAGSRGALPSHYAPGSRSGARMVPGVSGDWSEPPISRDGFCSEMTRHGVPCKAHPVAGSPLCIGHTRQKAAS
jgi:hypothetical protein